MKLVLKYPSRSRPDLFKSTFAQWRDMASGKHEIEWIVSMDFNDGKMNNDDIRAFLDAQKNVTYCYGESEGKISAINQNLSSLPAEYDILVLVSDDMIPQVQGYDDIICQKMTEHFPDMDGALHFNDGRVTGIITLSILGKKLYDRFGYIYHPDYVSLWCDNEFTDVVKMWDKYAYIPEVVVKHAWTDVTGGDLLHSKNESYYDRDKKVYDARKAAGFPAESIGVVSRPRSAKTRFIDQRRRQISRRPRP